jgi:hypothetical protein
MLPRKLSVALILSLFVTSSITAVGQETQQSVPEMRKITLKAIEKNRQVTAVLKNMRDKVTGIPSNVSEQGFTIQQGSGQQDQLEFEEIRELRTKGSHWGRYVGLGAAAIVGVIVAVGLAKLTSD